MDLKDQRLGGRFGLSGVSMSGHKGPGPRSADLILHSFLNKFCLVFIFNLVTVKYLSSNNVLHFKACSHTQHASKAALLMSGKALLQHSLSYKISHSRLDLPLRAKADIFQAAF